MNLDKQNSRRHSDRNKAAIRKSLETAKAARSIVIDSGDNVLAGNGVAEQWEAMGGKVRVVETSGDELVAVKRVDVAPDSPQARQIATLDNLVADTSAFDYDAERLREALANDPVSKAIAEQDERLRKLLKVTKPESVDAGELVDKAAQLQEKWQVKRGDLWQCGKHRILCGDSTNAEDVARVMQGEKAQLLASDPPYNVGIDYGEKVDDNKAIAEYESFTRAWFGAWQAVSDRQIITPAFANLWAWMRFFEKPKHTGAWTKGNSMTRGSVCQFSCFEPVLFYGDKFKRTRHDELFNYPVGIPDVGHPCPKPPAFWVDLIENYSEQGDVVADAFLGSGTTLIAAEQTGRIGRGVEIEPKYVAVSLERLANLGLTCERIE